MAFQLSPKGYAAWLVQRSLLTSLETLVLDAALDSFIRPAAAPGGKPQEKTRPPLSYNEWTLQRGQLADAQATAIDSMAQALIDARKKLKTPVPATPPPGIPPPSNFPEYWKQEKTAAISLGSAGSQEVIPARQGYRIFIVAIVFSVSDETDIRFTFGTFGLSGSMDFGGTDEPRAIVMTMGDSPTPCGPGPFRITSNGTTAAVGGFAVYTEEKEQKEKRL